MISIIVVSLVLIIIAVIINNQYYEIRQFLQDHISPFFISVKFKAGDLLEELRPNYLEDWEEYELAQLEILEVGREKYRLMVIRHSDLTKHSHSFSSNSFMTRLHNVPPAISEESVKFSRVHESFIKIGRSEAGHLTDADNILKSIT